MNVQTSDHRGGSCRTNRIEARPIARLRHKLESTNVQGVALVSIRSMGYMLQTD